MAPSTGSSARPHGLVIAERWLREAGKQVQWGEITVGTANAPPQLQPMLVVQQGPISVFVRCLDRAVSEDTLSVLVVTDVPMPIRQKIAGISSDLRTKMHLVFRQALISDARTTFSIIPQTLTKIEQLERYVVDQVVFVDESEASTRNRLLDAVVETTVVSFRAGQVLAMNVSGSGVFQTGQSDRAGHDSMFR